MNILITGGGFGNKGAEAMLIALSRFLHSRLGDVRVYHAAARSEWAERLPQYGIVPLPGRERAPLPLRLFEFAKSQLPLRLSPWPHAMDANRMPMDAVLDVSGFASGDQWGTGSARRRWWEVHQAKSLGIPIVLMPQAWGPFERPWVRAYTRTMLSGVELVFARDRQSMGHLRSLGVLHPKALEFAADIAFQFTGAGPEVGHSILAKAGVRRDERPLVGIVPNVGVYFKCRGEGAANGYVKALASICRHLIRVHDTCCVVVLHTTEGADGGISDSRIARLLREDHGLGEEGVVTVGGERTAAELKAVIGVLDFLVASRFHSLIAALSTRTPCVAIGWSYKYVELMADVGLGSFVCGAQQLETGALDLVERAWASRENMRTTLDKNVPKLETSSAQALESAASCVLDRTAPTQGWKQVWNVSQPSRNDVSEVVRDGLCTGCGACRNVCPSGAVTMCETRAGALVARVDSTRCDNCGACLRACPGSHLERGLLPEGTDPFKGPIRGAYVCQSTDRELLAEAQSGGVVSTLLTDMLGRKEIRGAVVTLMPEDGSLRPRAIFAEDPQTVLEARGSKYCPVDVCSVMPDPADETAFVGLSCHVHALRNAQQNHLVRGAPFVVGLVCDRVYSYGLVEHLIGYSSIARPDVCGFCYRSKKWCGWPGDVRVVGRDGEDEMVSRDHRMRAKDAFTLARCWLCFDKLNVLSDISVGDAHQLSDDLRGSSLVFVRTSRGEEVMEDARARGILEMRPVTAEDACNTSQNVEERRRRWATCMWLARTRGISVPDSGIAPRWLAAGRLRPHLYRHRFEWSRRATKSESLGQMVREAQKQIHVQRLRSSLGARSWLYRANKALTPLARGLLARVKPGR